ncbi:MAG TPA: DUF92 domain-containing protein [Puia sp.]|nr:DUF92 domain-containing protein [Puia sp.]
MRSSGQIIVLLLLLTGIAASIRWKKLTIPAALMGGVVGWLVYTGGGYTGLLMLAAFFVLGTVATSWHTRMDMRRSGLPHPTPDSNPPDPPKGKGAAPQSTRTTGQVLANGGVAALAGLCILCRPDQRQTLEILMAASLSSATADTLSSELGMVYGRHHYNVLTWRRDQRGLDGVVSLEGSLLGIAGSSVIALLYTGGHGWNNGFWIIVLSGAIGNLTDSILGASLERKGRLGNDMVNFLNTLTAGLLGGLLALAQ